MKTFAALLIALILSGCASLGIGGASLEAQWQTQQTIYNATLTQIIAAREPCVTTAARPDYGPENPGCLIGDATYKKIITVRDVADGYLKAAEVALQTSDDSKAKFYLTASTGALTAIAQTLAQGGKQ